MNISPIASYIFYEDISNMLNTLVQDKEVEQGGSAPRILSLDDYFLVEKEIETKDDNGKKVTVKV